MDSANSAVLQRRAGHMNRPTGYSQWRHITFGAGLAGLLYWACAAMPKWPLHPVGLLLVRTWYGENAWASIFLGWLVKMVLV